MIIDETPFHVGSFLVQRVPSSSATYRAIHEHYWRGYLCPETVSPQLISKVGKLIEVTSREQLKTEREAYRAEISPSIKVEFAYYEVIDAGSA
jgi:hypothetical protein